MREIIGPHGASSHLLLKDFCWLASSEGIILTQDQHANGRIAEHIRNEDLAATRIENGTAQGSDSGAAGQFHSQGQSRLFDNCSEGGPASTLIWTFVLKDEPAQHPVISDAFKGMKFENKSQTGSLGGGSTKCGRRSRYTSSGRQP